MTGFNTTAPESRGRWGGGFGFIGKIRQRKLLLCRSKLTARGQRRKAVDLAPQLEPERDLLE